MTMRRVLRQGLVMLLAAALLAAGLPYAPTMACGATVSLHLLGHDAALSPVHYVGSPDLRADHGGMIHAQQAGVDVADQSPGAASTTPPALKNLSCVMCSAVTALPGHVAAPDDFIRAITNWPPVARGESAIVMIDPGIPIALA